MHWLDITLLLLLLFSMVRGYRSGFISQAIELGTVVLAWVLANPASLVIIDLFAHQGVTLVGGWVTWLISFLVVLGLSRFLLRFLLKGVGAALGKINKLAGSLLSLIVTTLLLVVLLNFYTSLSPRYHWGGIPKESTIAPEIQRIGETILPTRLLIQQEVEKHLTPKEHTMPAIFHDEEPTDTLNSVL